MTERSPDGQLWRCMLGHTRRAMECPACAELGGASPQPETSWRWYRRRTQSKRIRSLIDERLKGFASAD
jgi:hypothetical protein